MHIKIDKNDKLFSQLIRDRDGNKCVFCGRSEDQGYRMTCSHFWGRGHKSTRFDPLNCDTLCFQCHMKHEGNKQGFYREWKMNQLGEEGYEELTERNRKFAKYGEYEKELVKKHLKEHGLERYEELLKKIQLC